MQMPSKINYKVKKNRAGYLASFGERHAYLPYYRLREISQKFSAKIPQPQDGELTLTLLGGAAAVEAFGVLYYFNEKTQIIRRLNLVTIEKVVEWDDVRRLYINTLLKDFFRKVSIKDIKISADLTQPRPDIRRRGESCLLRQHTTYSFQCTETAQREDFSLLSLPTSGGRSG